MLYRDFMTLLDVSDAGTAPLTGDAFLLNPLSVDRVADHDQEVVVTVSGAHSGGGGTDPSVEVIVESSPDGETWFELWSDTFTATTFSGTGRPRLEDNVAGEPSALFAYVRARTELYGSPAPSQDVLTVHLGSTAPLRARRV